MNITYEIRFPFEMQIGITFNNGHDYQYFPYIYENSFPQPKLTSISPDFTFRHEFNLTVFGLKLNLGVNCSIYSSKATKTLGLEIYETPVQLVGGNDSTSSICAIPESLLTTRSSIFVTMKNEQGEINTDGFTLNLYVPPDLTGLVPAFGGSFGGYKISIIGDGILNIPTIFCKFGNILCEKPCVHDGVQVLCEVPAHPPGKVSFSLSYTKIDWHLLNTTQFTYTTCDAGYTSSTYKVPCSLCKPGTYKPTVGLYECIPCGAGTFNSFAGALSCEKCPVNTTGISQGSASHENCLCDEGLYVNPDHDTHAGAFGKCIPCPKGAFCNFNTTEPLALPGYWNSETNIQNFYSCIPKESCGGYSRANCTRGYKGIRCGQCVNTYYKFRNNCSECGDPGLIWLRLIGIGGALAIVTAVFFVLSSAKVQHIASIAIAFSFWQVLSMFARFDIKWPSLIGGTLTASSVANFNTDFLSPNCIFPGMTYVSLWVLQMLMPVYFLACFSVLYTLLIIRSLFATVIGKVLNLMKVKVKYVTPIVRNVYDDEEEEETKKSKKIIKKITTTIKNLLALVTNIFIWTTTQKSSGRDFVKILNRIINAFFAFLSFNFIFIMTTASEVFVCTQQPDGLFTLNSSPDIRCYFDATWFTMVPMTILWYLIFGGGSAIYFILIYFNYSKWSL